MKFYTVGLLLPVVLLTCPPAFGAAPLAERLPRETCFALVTENFAELSTAFRKTNLGEALCGAEFSPLVRELERLDRATPLNLRPWFGVSWEELSRIAGPGALAVFPHSKGQLGAVCLIDATGSADAKKQCLAAGERYFLSKYYRKSVVRTTDAELIVFEPPPSLKGEPARIHFTSGDYFGAANSRAAAEALLAVQAANSLAAQPQFQKLATSGVESAEPKSARLFVRPTELWSLSRGEQSGVKQSMRDRYVMAQRQGFSGLQAAGGVLSFSSDEVCETSFVLNVAHKSPLQKAMGLVSFKPGPGLALPAWLEANATSVATWQWDFPAAMKAFGNLFDESNEPGPDGDGLFEDLLSGLRDDPEGPKVDLRRELFARLGPQVLSLTDRQAKPSPSNTGGERLLYVLACRESPKVAVVLKKFYDGDKHVKFEKLGDVHFWTAPEGASLFVEGENSSVIQLRAVAVTAGELFFSTDPAMLRAALSRKPATRPLTGDKDWQALQTWFAKSRGEDPTVQSFVRSDSFLEMSYLAVRSGKPRTKESYQEALLHYLLFGVSDPGPKLPYAALPEFDKLRTRLRPMGVQLMLTAEGWQVRGGLLGLP